MKVYIIDNYDSFTYNLYQYIGELLSRKKALGQINNISVIVKRNNEATLEDVKAEDPDRIIISPGPGSPDDPKYFGICGNVIRELGKYTPLLGVCLGMQGIVHAFGGDIIKSQVPVHGKTSLLSHLGDGLFASLPADLEVMRYHSLIADNNTFPNCLKITAVVGTLPSKNSQELGRTQNYEIMGVQHKTYPIYGVQFHPESFASEGGQDLLGNFLFGMYGP